MNRKPLRIKKFETGKNWDDPRTAEQQADEYKVGQLAGGFTTRTLHPHGDEHLVIVEVY